MSDERFDRVIDEVARQMTEGELPGDFRGRMIARLGDRPRRMWTIWTLAPIAAAALVIIAIFIARPSKERDVAPTRVNQTVQVPPSPQSGFGATGPPSPQSGFGATSKPGAAYEGLHETGRKNVRRPGPSGLVAASDLDALAPPRLEVAPLDVEALSTASIAVTQLDAIAPIAVEPLPANDQRP